jgi:hypothetical protein
LVGGVVGSESGDGVDAAGGLDARLSVAMARMTALVCIVGAELSSKETASNAQPPASPNAAAASPPKISRTFDRSMVFLSWR